MKMFCLKIAISLYNCLFITFQIFFERESSCFVKCRPTIGQGYDVWFGGWRYFWNLELYELGLLGNETGNEDKLKYAGHMTMTGKESNYQNSSSQEVVLKYFW